MTTPRRAGRREHRQQLNAEIDKDLVAEFQAVFLRSGRKRWEVLQDVVAYGLAEYQRREREAPGTLDLLDRAG
ncbi:hypothetical protein [Dietzia sp. 179-F 9C3 NHS]|uniref:hypothetical protein n=1 Tax=Dietzia sp. 179-F 9C3 NHS TaxID=3374295 RepID=UPI00387A1BCE